MQPQNNKCKVWIFLFFFLKSTLLLYFIKYNTFLIHVKKMCLYKCDQNSVKWSLTAVEVARSGRVQFSQLPLHVVNGSGGVPIRVHLDTIPTASWKAGQILFQILQPYSNTPNHWASHKNIFIFLSKTAHICAHSKIHQTPLNAQKRLISAPVHDDVRFCETSSFA